MNPHLDLPALRQPAAESPSPDALMPSEAPSETPDTPSPNALVPSEAPSENSDTPAPDAPMPSEAPSETPNIPAPDAPMPSEAPSETPDTPAPDAPMPSEAPEKEAAGLSSAVVRRFLETSRQWQVMEEAVVGLSHRVRNAPGQDAVCVHAKGARAVLVLADGAGSSPVSEQGAQAVVTGCARVLGSEAQWNGKPG